MQQWPEKQPDIVRAWQHARDNNLYRNVLDRYTKQTVASAYALTNQLEYFAELSCMYFVRCNYEPSDRKELEEYDPVGYEMIRKIDQGEIRGLLSICFNPLVSLPDNAFVRRTLEKLEFYVALDFFPAQWLASITGLHASMTMGQPFPDVWLPRGLDMQLGLMLAIGAFDFQYTLDYHDYRRAEITTTIRDPGAR